MKNLLHSLAPVLYFVQGMVQVVYLEKAHKPVWKNACKKVLIQRNKMQYSSKSSHNNKKYHEILFNLLAKI